MAKRILSWDEVIDFAQSVPFYNVSTGQPYQHEHKAGGRYIEKPTTGGLTYANDPLMRETGGTWIAWGKGPGDRAYTDWYNKEFGAKHDLGGGNDSVRVPKDDPRYRLQRVFLTNREAKGHYDTLCNAYSWPIFHDLFDIDPVSIDSSSWRYHLIVNEKFAGKIPNVGKPLVITHDYHHAPLAYTIKERNPHAVVPFFWHIPWPPPRRLGKFPWAREILDYMSYFDLIGFQTKGNREKFLACFGELMPEARVDSREGVIDYQGRNILTGVYPISIDFKKFDEMARNPIIDPETLHTGKYVIFSHQRLDYTKGIPEMLRAYYNFLTTHWRNSSGNIVLVLVGAPSRVHVTGYKMTNRDVNNQVNFINQEIGQGKWKPVEFKNEALPHEKIVPYLVRADIYIMNSIAEGMGLNSKEFALCNYHKKSARGRGLLIQSELAGVADELGPYSILVDPYNSKEISDAIMEGLHLPRGKRDSDIAAMRNHIKRRDGHYWLRTFMTDIMSIYEHEL